MARLSSHSLSILIETSIKEKSFTVLKNTLQASRPEDIAEAMDGFPAEIIIESLTHISGKKYFEVFEHIDLDMQVKLTHHLNRKQTIKILEELSPDDRVDLLDRLPDKTVDMLLPLMAQAERDEAKRLLQYEEDTAGAIMTTEYAALPISYTSSEALQHLQKIAPHSETIYYLYITDENKILRGRLSLKELILAYPYERIQDIMKTDVISVDSGTDKEDVAKQLAKYDLVAIPVVDTENKLVGIVTIDDAMDVVVEEQTEDIHRMGGIDPIEIPYLKVSFWSLARNRGLWLFILFFSVLITVGVLKHFHQTLEAAVALAYFIPLIISSGGNTGSQSVTLITRALAVGDVQRKDFKKVVIRETLMGCVLGILLGGVGFLCALIMGTSQAIYLSVSIAMFGVVLSGSLIGGMLPIILEKMGLDPAIMSSPLVASVVDVIGVLIYFNVAKIFL